VKRPFADHPENHLEEKIFLVVFLTATLKPK